MKLDVEMKVLFDDDRGPANHVAGENLPMSILATGRN